MLCEGISWVTNNIKQSTRFVAVLFVLEKAFRPKAVFNNFIF